MKEAVKVDYFLSHPIQYFSPLFRKMAEKMDLSVYYFSDLSVKGEVDKETLKRESGNASGVGTG